MITVRVRLFFRLFAIFCIPIAIYAIGEKILAGESLSFQEWFVLAGSPLLAFSFLFVGQTLTYRLTSDQASVYWKIGIGKFKLWEQTNYHLKWHEVVRVYSVFPVWLPFHMIGVSGIQNGMQGRNFFIGSVTTKKKEALLYVADHVSPKAIDEEVQRLVKRYRAKARKKENISTPAK